MSDTYTSFHGEFKWNDLVCMELLIGCPDEKRTGRLVQVRKGAGAFGSDIYLIRLRDGGLESFQNVLMRRADDRRFERAFYETNGKTAPVIPDQPPHESDDVKEVYSIGEEWPEIGFIIEKPKQPKSPTQSFSMVVIGK